jgi:RNA polymerase sigma-70 factor (ECF subfamily)
VSLSDDELVKRAVRGDQDALSTLLNLYGPQIQSTLDIGRRWRSSIEAEDVMQVTYLEAFLRFDELAIANTRSFVSWLTRVAQNNLRDALRALDCAKRPSPQRRVSATVGADSFVALFDVLSSSTTAPSRHAVRRDNQAALEGAIAGLSETYQTVVRLYDLEGRSPSEVASAMGRSVGAVHLLRIRAHDRLRERLGSRSDYLSSGA